MSSDSTVNALVSHLNEIETHRRVLLMSTKEAQTRLAHLEDDDATTQKERDTLVNKEATARSRLSQLHEEQRLLSLQLSDGTGQLRRSESEEPFLTNNATDQSKQAAQQLANWEGQIERLASVTKLWASNTLVAPLLKEMDESTAELRTSTDEEKALVEAIAAAMVESSKSNLNSTSVSGINNNNNNNPNTINSTSSGGHNAFSTCGDGSNSNTSDVPDTPRCRAQLASLKRDLASEEAAATRITQVLQREVEGLRMRQFELQQWVDAARSKMETAESLTALLDEALTHRTCRSCRG